MCAYYAQRAPYYDAVYDKPERAKDIAFLAGALPNIFAGKNVLEVACGTGYWTQHIARNAARVVATDGTAEPIQIARLRSHCSRAMSRVMFRQENAYALSDDLGSFDAAFAGLWFSHIPISARTKFFSSLHARLLPGARVVFIDNNEVQLNDFPIVETDDDGNTYQRRTLKDESIHRALKNFPTEAELLQLIAPFSQEARVQQLENFWMVEYALVAL